MDISVSRLNNRMALQVPGELPLGLVFIVGRVENLGAPAEGTVRFELVDAGYHLRCRLPAAVAEETLLKEGDRARASGHLAFDSHSAQYELLARDIEVLAARPPTDEAQAATAVQPSADAASLAPTELPPWVRKLAPPEVKKELGLEQEGEREPSLEPDAAGEPRREMGDRATELPPEMVAFLSNAIDSDEEIELTPEMIAEYLPQPTPHEEEVGETEPTTAAAEEEEEVITKEEGEPTPAREGAAGPPMDEANEEQEEEEREVEVAAPDAESPTPPPAQVLAAPQSEAPEAPHAAVLSPPQGAPRREVRDQPQPQPAAPATTRRYLEYAAIAFLVILIIVALFLILLLLQS